MNGGVGREAPKPAVPSPPPPDLAPLLTNPMPAVGVKFHYFGDYELLEEVARGGMGGWQAALREEDEAWRREE